MNCIKKILLILFIIFLINPVSIYAKRGTRTWDDLLESSEIIASAFLTKIESNMENNRHIAYFKIDRVYKGEKINSLEIMSSAKVVEDTVYLSELGKYIIFLKKNTEAYSNYLLESERFLKCNYLQSPNGNLISVIDENSYRYLTGIPDELFSEEEIRLTAYDKHFDYKAKIINFRSVERWFERNYLN